MISFIVFFLFLVLYGFFIEPDNVVIKHITVADSSLDKILNGLKIVQLSDLHIKQIGYRERKIIDLLTNLNPDIIFLTGDYVEWRGDYTPAIKFLSKLNATIGIWAVMGDYDYSDSRKACMFCHQEYNQTNININNIKFLRNSYEKINIQGKILTIFGFDLERKLSYLPINFFKHVNDYNPAIVLCHNPEIFEIFSKGDEIVILSGDTHGGQIPLPPLVWKMIDYKKNFKYNKGIIKEGGKFMYVSKGIGTSHLPFRIMNKPEIVVFHF